MIYICVLIGVALIATLLMPFFGGAGGVLASAALVRDPDQLESLKTQILKRYLDDEAAFKRGEVSAATWQKRQDFLTNRYLDAARRLDFLRQLATDGGRP